MLKTFISLLFFICLICSVLSVNKLSNAQQDPPQEQEVKPEDATIKIQQILVNVNVSVIDEKTRTVPNLKLENFELYCGKIKQEINFFDMGSKPIIMGIVFDISGSMEPSKYHIARIALRELMQGQREGDRYFVVLFDKFTSTPILNSKTKSIFTSDPINVTSAIPEYPPKLSTSFYDGVMLGLDILGPEKESRAYNLLSDEDKAIVDSTSDKRKILVVISDGQDNSSRSTEREITESLREKEINIHTITITDPQRGTTYALQGEGIMQSLAKKSGGINFIPEAPHQITEACSRIRKLISHQYVLGFYYSGPYDGKFKKFDIKLKPPKGSPKLTAKYREGFIAPLEDKPKADKSKDKKVSDPPKK